MHDSVVLLGHELLPPQRSGSQAVGDRRRLAPQGVGAQMGYPLTADWQMGGATTQTIRPLERIG